MKRTNGVRAAYDAFLLRELQVAFGRAADFNTSKEAYPWPLLFFATVRAAYDAFLLRAFHAAFGHTAVANTPKEAYLWPLIVLCHCRLASFTEAP